MDLSSLGVSMVPQQAAEWSLEQQRVAYSWVLSVEPSHFFDYFVVLKVLLLPNSEYSFFPTHRRMTPCTRSSQLVPVAFEHEALESLFVEAAYCFAELCPASFSCKRMTLLQ